jgi:hypothetical protein
MRMQVGMATSEKGIGGESVNKIDEAIEQLMCAEINCDNGKVLGPVMFEAVKMQIQEAIKILKEAKANG